MRILVTGCAGMLGSALVPAFVAAGHEVFATDINLTEPSPWGPGHPTITHLDVRDRQEIRHVFSRTTPEIVLHLAAETSLEISDADPDHAYLTNAIGTKYVALQARADGIPMVYISTAGIFDGVKETPYTEFDAPNPLNTYGASKYEGELIVAQVVEQHYIARAGWMVGGGPKKDHKFVSRIVDQIRDGAQVVHAVTDKLGTPTYAPDFSRCLLGLIDSGVCGTYHMVSGGEGSRYDVAQRILEVLGRRDVELVPVTSDFFAEEFSSVRPRSEVMRNMVLDLQGMNTMRPWQVALEEYLMTEFASLCAPDVEASVQCA
jgi:dTDP-4-dehydrorhamnose reductase